MANNNLACADLLFSRAVHICFSAEPITGRSETLLDTQE